MEHGNPPAFLSPAGTDGCRESEVIGPCHSVDHKPRLIPTRHGLDDYAIAQDGFSLPTELRRDNGKHPKLPQTQSANFGNDITSFRL